MLYFVHYLPGQWSSQAKMDKAFWKETSKLGYNNIVFTVYRKKWERERVTVIGKSYGGNKKKTKQNKLTKKKT